MRGQYNQDRDKSPRRVSPTKTPNQYISSNPDREQPDQKANYVINQTKTQTFDKQQIPPLQKGLAGSYQVFEQNPGVQPYLSEQNLGNNHTSYSNNYANISPYKFEDTKQDHETFGWLIKTPFNKFKSTFGLGNEETQRNTEINAGAGQSGVPGQTNFKSAVSKKRLSFGGSDLTGSSSSATVNSTQLGSAVTTTAALKEDQTVQAVSINTRPL